jgi:Cu(I)/Ag(I) efflux system protein CusF
MRGDTTDKGTTMKHWIAAALFAAGVAQAQNAMTEGEVQKVDAQAGKIVLKHGEIKKLDMPAMTMSYRVANPALLDKVQPGDKVRFNAEKVGGQFTVTAIEPAK